MICFSKIRPPAREVLTAGLAFRNEASLEVYFECPCFKCLMHNEMAQIRVRICKL